ncbi:hypothetical protein [Brenneria uluponensis]|uniref:hypothetical protein n=1 Tax=Brenneria uluponensis TaxID=3057057 RepID=UPI0028F02B99|nr:hypothetical protein [Brenneria ulupoensis]
MTQIQCYLDDTYRFHSSSEIIDSGSDESGQWIALKDNIFHPQGGGQPADVGWVNDIPVRVGRLSADKVILYPETPLSTMDSVPLTATLSAADRLLHAALHTAGHLLNWEMRQYGWMAVSGHHFPGESRVEFSPMGSTAMLVDKLPLPLIQTNIQALLRDGRPVTTWHEEETRLCLIEGTEPMPCGGTHVDNLNKITEFSIKSVKFKKGKLRISYDASHAV